MTTRRIRLADSEVASLLVCYRAGVSLERLSREIGRDRRVLRRVLLEAGVPLRTRHRLPVEQTDWVLTRYHQGATLRGLAELTGCSHSSIRRVLLRAGATLRSPGSRAPQAPTDRTSHGQSPVRNDDDHGPIRGQGTR